jgi:hypothetical protein
MAVQTIRKNKMTVNMHLWVREAIAIKQQKQKSETQKRQPCCMQAGDQKHCIATNHL